MTTIFEESSPTREIGDGEHLKKMFSLADERPLSDDGSLVRGCVEELVAAVARHPALGVVGGVPPHLERRRSLGDLLFFQFTWQWSPGGRKRGSVSGGPGTWYYGDDNEVDG